MNIKLIYVGKIKDKHYKTGINDFIQRINNYTKLTTIQINDEKIVNEQYINIAKEKEAEKIIKAIPNSSYKIALTEFGKVIDSIKFSGLIRNITNQGNSNLIFIVGGAVGLHKKIIDLCDYKLALSEMTFPHQIAQLVLLEQIYRSFKILNNEPYHK